MAETKSFYKTLKELETVKNPPIPFSLLEENFDIDKVTGISWNTDNDVVSSITIYFAKEDPELTQSIKDSIMSVLGDNHTKTIQFTKVKNHDEAYGLYTYRKDVYVLKDGYDIPFDSLKLEEQIKISDMFDAKEWIENNTLQ